MIRSLLASNDLTSIITRAKGLVKRVWNFTKPVLCAQAPDCSCAEDDDHETKVPDHEEARAQNLIGEYDDDDNGEEDLDGPSNATPGPKHKTALSACWRGMKEARYLWSSVFESCGTNGLTTYHLLYFGYKRIAD